MKTYDQRYLRGQREERYEKMKVKNGGKVRGKGENVAVSTAYNNSNHSPHVSFTFGIDVGGVDQFLHPRNVTIATSFKELSSGVKSLK